MQYPYKAVEPLYESHLVSLNNFEINDDCYYHLKSTEPRRVTLKHAADFLEGKWIDLTCAEKNSAEWNAYAVEIEGEKKNDVR